MKRRDFLKVLGASSVAAAVGPLAAGAARDRPLGKARDKPNIVYVLADDLGWAELGCYGNTFNETPNLDKLAAQGMRFTDAYAAAPVCSPYRAALMSGQCPARIGVTDYLRPSTNWHLPDEMVTLPEMLQTAGYVTGMTGKWHLSGYVGGKVKSGPGKHGFDQVVISEQTGIGGGSYFHPYSRVSSKIKPVLKTRDGEKEFLTDRLNHEAVKFIERNKDKPFFFFKSHYSVHTALRGQRRLVEYFKKKLASGDGDKGKKFPKKANPVLAAMLKVIDDGVGMIVEKLEELKIAEKTIVIFTSDNGGESRVTSNAPLRAGKSTTYEGGIREPLIVKWPGKVKGGSVCSAPTMNIDFYPTFAEIAGAAAKRHKLDGVSIVPLLRGKTIDRDTLYWHYPLRRPHFLGGRSSGAIRKGDWKLIEFFDRDPHQVELFNLADDMGEKNNLAAKHRDKVAELLGLLDQWRRETMAPGYREIRKR